MACCLWVRGRQDRLRLMDKDRMEAGWLRLMEMGRMEAGQAEANGQG